MKPKEERVKDMIQAIKDALACHWATDEEIAEALTRFIEILKKGQSE